MHAHECAHAHACVCPRVYGSIRVYKHLCPSMQMRTWRPEVNPEDFPQALSTCVFLTQNLSLTWDPPSIVGWSASQLRRSVTPAVLGL